VPSSAVTTSEPPAAPIVADVCDAGSGTTPSFPVLVAGAPVFVEADVV
jgi:hypothetical protein